MSDIAYENLWKLYMKLSSSREDKIYSIFYPGCKGTDHLNLILKWPTPTLQSLWTPPSLLLTFLKFKSSWISTESLYHLLVTLLNEKSWTPIFGTQYMKLENSTLLFSCFLLLVFYLILFSFPPCPTKLSEKTPWVVNWRQVSSSCTCTFFFSGILAFHVIMPLNTRNSISVPPFCVID